MVEAMRFGSSSGAKATKKTPWAKSDNTSCAISTLRRVLPTPGGPTKVMRRLSGLEIYSCSSVTSRSRPISAVGGTGRFGCGNPVERRQGAASTCPAGADFQSPRAKRKKAFRSFEGIRNTSASRSTICADGRRSSASILRNVMVEQLSCWASCSCVHPPAFRWRLSHSPKDDSSANVLSKTVSLIVSLSDTW